MNRLAALLFVMIAVWCAPSSARADGEVELPVLVRALGQSDIIGEADIDWITLPFGKVPRNAITDPRDLIGMAPVRLVRPGQPVRQGDVAPPIVVKRNTLVTMVFNSGNLFLSAKGKVLENGAEGDRVQVENLQSEVVVEGLVMADGTIAVGFF